jgi:hypothetical protein
MQWTSPNGELLLPSRRNDLELEKNKSLESLDNNDSGGTAFRQIALMGNCAALYIKIGLTKKCSAQEIGCSNPSHTDFMSWMRN